MADFMRDYEGARQMKRVIPRNTDQWNWKVLQHLEDGLVAKRASRASACAHLVVKAGVTGHHERTPRRSEVHQRRALAIGSKVLHWRTITFPSQIVARRQDIAKHV